MAKGQMRSNKEKRKPKQGYILMEADTICRVLEYE